MILSDDVFRSIEVFSSGDEEDFSIEDPVEARNAETLLEGTGGKSPSNAFQSSITQRKNSIKSKVSKI